MHKGGVHLQVVTESWSPQRWDVQLWVGCT